jgi:hypothetical protein
MYSNATSAILAVSLGLLAFACPAARAQVDASDGSATCDTVIGKMVFSPPALASGAAATTVLKIKADVDTCTVSTSSPVSVVHGSRLSATLTVPVSDCAALLSGPTPVTGSAVVKWKTDQRLVASTTSFSPTQLSGTSFDPGWGGTYVALTLGGPGSASTGSFGGSDGGASSIISLQINQDASVLEAACNGRGLKKVLVGQGQVKFQ